MTMMDQLRHDARQRRDLGVAELEALQLARRDPARARGLFVEMERRPLINTVEEQRRRLEVSAFDVVLRDFYQIRRARRHID